MKMITTKAFTGFNYFGLSRCKMCFVKTQFFFATSSASAERHSEKEKINDVVKDKSKSKGTIVPHEFRHVFPDFLPDADFERRHPIKEKLERQDMLKRRLQIDIPEFYVGSILAVTCSDAYAPKRTNRFVGICIERGYRGLWHAFQLRNVIDGIAVEVPYDMYNPLIQSMQVLRLEKRPDENLRYLRDALLEYSTFSFDMQPESLPAGSPVPVNMTKVKLKPPPWTENWHMKGMYGIEEIWDQQDFMRKQRFRKSKFDLYKKYDIVDHYRHDTPIEDQQEIYDHALEFEEQNQTQVKRGGKRITTVSGTFKHHHQQRVEIPAGPKSSSK